MADYRPGVAVNLRLSPEARDALERWAADEGVTFTSIVEAVGQLILEGEWKPQPAVIARARQVAAARRSRRPDD